MRRFTSILILLVCLALLPVAPAAAGFFDVLFKGDPLVSIDGTRYSADDFKRWWQFWQEPEQALPKTPDPYIEWLLLAREGKGMQLDEDPGFKRQTKVYLQARGLLMLKNEAVDSRIKVSDADIKARYEEKFLPRWLVQNLEFKDDAAAKAAWQELTAGTLKVDELLTRDPEQGGPVKSGENWVRPGGIDPGWETIFRKLKVGEVVNPDEHEGGPGLYCLKDQKGGDEEDLAKFREEIMRTLWKEQEDALTRALLDELRRKYEVVVDQERIDSMDIAAPDDTFTETAVITTNQKNVTEQEFIAVVRKLMAGRPAAAHAAKDPEEARKLKAETLTNIIAQSVTNWEALDRHYEEKEPFKWQYQFNYNHRLVIALEERLFMPEAVVTEAEIKQHYDENKPLYTQPEMVRLYIIDANQGPVDQLWAEVMTGKNFQKVLGELFQQRISPQEAPANHLDPDIKAMVDKMAVGETSPISTAQGSRVIVYLEERTPESLLPLERATGTITTRLKRQKVQQAADAFIEKIRSRSQIEVSKRQWQAIQKELGGA
jgi:hypothetical protein